MLGLVGDRLMAQKISDLCKVFLAEKLDVQLSDDKTQITNVTKNSVRFLGVDIKRPPMGESPRVSYSRVVKRVVKSRILLPPRINKRLLFYLPVKTILAKLTSAGYIKSYISKDGISKLVPNAITK